jgi:hypothetical protein
MQKIKKITGTVCNLLVFEYYTTRGSALEVCRCHPVDQLLDQQLKKPKETGEEEEEIAENNGTFLDILRKPAAVRK